MNKKGSTLLIALTILIFAFLMGSMLIFSARSRRFERNEFVEHMNLYYAAESGIIKAYHRLKNNSFERRFYFPKKTCKIKGNINSINYEVSLTDGRDSKSHSVLISSTAYFGSREITIDAKAYFKRREKIIENNPYYLKREIYELWELAYIK